MSDHHQGLIRQRLTEAQRILLVSHIRPDGDAVGSLLGLGLALEEAGKEIQMVLEDGVPGSFRHLVGSERIKKQADGAFDYVVVLDCSDLERVGNALANYSTPDLNVDHHNTNINFAAINLVDSQATATTEILAGILPEWNLQIYKPVAEALLTGLITDTIGFRTFNITPRTMKIAADLMERGANLPELYEKALNTRSFQAARYWGKGLSKIQVKNRLLWTTLSIEDRKSANYPGQDDADLVNILSTIEEADIYVIFIEQSKNSVKVSWRSRPGFDVSQIALKFGGGGHKPAAGAEIGGSLVDVTHQVLEATKALLNGNQ